MPHTSRKKKPLARSRRQQITDEEGWTRIVTTSKYLDCMAASKGGRGSNEHPPADLYEPYSDGRFLYDQTTSIPDGATLEKLTAQFDKLEKRWLSSEAWKALKQNLSAQLEAGHSISTCVLFGSGSYCGYRDNWIERHHIALVQTAVFKAVIDTVEQIQGQPPPCYAQEPSYNALDVSFLENFNITVVTDPQGFSLLTDRSFAYIPGAEVDVTMRTTFRQPCLLLGAELDLYYRNVDGTPWSARSYHYINQPERQEDADDNPENLVQEEDFVEKTGRVEAINFDENENCCQILERFQASHDSVKLPEFEMQDYPFHKQYFYYRREGNDDEKRKVGDSDDKAEPV